MQALLAALNAREEYTAAHSHAVVGLAMAVARELGLEEPEVAEVGQVALLHDVGKVGVPDEILRKPGRLTASEWAVMYEHPAIGARIISSIASLAHLAPAVRAEHERWDGDGYPDGLAGEQIPLASRICFVSDAYHAMTSDRPYRAAMNPADARAQIESNAGSQFCPITVAAFVRVLERGEHARPVRGEAATRSPLSSVATDFAPEPRVEAEFRALTAVTSAAATANTLDDVLEIAAEETRRVLRASSVSISRWDRERDLLHTLINVGELAPWEQRFPTDEVYRLADYPRARALVEGGEAYTVTIDDDSVPADRAVLEALGKGSVLGVPIVFGGEVWGELEAFADIGAPPFTTANVRFGELIAAQLSAAIGRAELFDRINALAYEDPLTGLANRRALDEHLSAAASRAAESGAELSLLFCDLDGLKALNDLHGHEAGDEALRRVARAIEQAASEVSGVFVARVGGDELCVVLDGHEAPVARDLAMRAQALLASGETPPVSFSSGTSSLTGCGPDPVDLLRAADAAQYVAKRAGAGLVRIAERGPAATANGDRPAQPVGRRRYRDVGGADGARLAE